MFDKDQARKMIIGRKNVNQELMKEKKTRREKKIRINEKQERKKSGEKRKQGRINIGTTKKGNFLK